MPNSVVIGAQWGDEGKAKVIDFLTQDSDLIIRYQGGANAGHTVVVNGEKFVFHMVPSGIMYDDKICLIGNGVVFDAEQFLLEVEELKGRGFNLEGRLFISDLAHLVLPYHKRVDGAREESRSKGKKIGTTGRGIGPAYSAKATRSGIRLGDFKNWDLFTAKLKDNFEESKRLVEVFYGGSFDLDFDELLAQYKKIADILSPLIIDTASYVFEANRSGKVLLFEGAQGTFLDIDHGTYPFVTSSNTTIGSVATGSGVSNACVEDVIGIVKTYTTRVGNGPFPTELLDETGDKLMTIGGEKGSTTGRNRRCGWFDSVLLRKAIQLNGFTTMALMKLDVLSHFDEIKMCTHYEIDGVKTEQYPTQLADLEKAVPIYETLPGWNIDITKCKSYDELPEKAKSYIKRLQELCYNLPYMMVSVGPDRSETIGIK
jgi:adenylosuccinate synthase